MKSIKIVARTTLNTLTLGLIAGTVFFSISLLKNAGTRYTSTVESDLHSIKNSIRKIA